jgi:hypothetical protein
MIGRRKSPDGLPFRLYLREGVRTISFGYKAADGSWLFRMSAPRARPEKVAEVRRLAIEEANKLNGEAAPSNNVTHLIDRYFKWQDEMRRGDERRKAESTLKENRRERKWLDSFFGEMQPTAIRSAHIYEFLDGRARTGAPAKANKEIALLSAILEYGRRIGEIENNPCVDIEYNPTRPNEKTVTAADLEYMTAIAKRYGGQYVVLALCAKAAYHAVGRPDEMRGLLRSGVRSEGVQIPVGKRRRGNAQRFKMAEWNQGLRDAIEQAMALQKVASVYVFANARGGSYNRNSWSNNWRKLMAFCVEAAAAEGRIFERFTLADMRPTSITKRMDEGDQRITDASGHVDERMVRKTYDRRKVKSFKATE